MRNLSKHSIDETDDHIKRATVRPVDTTDFGPFFASETVWIESQMFPPLPHGRRHDLRDWKEPSVFLAKLYPHIRESARVCKLSKRHEQRSNLALCIPQNWTLDMFRESQDETGE